MPSLKKLETRLFGRPRASQAEAEAGAANDKLMTPVRTVQSIINGKIASSVEAVAGAINNKLITPLRMAEFFAAKRTQITFHTSGRSSVERTAALPIGDESRSVISVLVPVVAGDLLICTGSFQATNMHATLNILMTSQLILTVGGGSSTQAVSQGEITEANGCNITPGMHHDHQIKTGLLRSPITSNAARVNLIGRADCWTAAPALRVDQDYGWLDVIRIRNWEG